MVLHFPAPLGRASRAALVIAHPGHELRLHGWLETVLPDVIVLTDGSGSSGRPRLASTAGLLCQVGAHLLNPTDALPDAELYDVMLRGDVDRVRALTAALADALDRAAVDYVVADAAEAFNPAHDLCRAMVDAAVGLLRRRGRRLASFEFPLEGPPDACPVEDRTCAVWMHLDDADLERKVRAARAYVGLEAEVEQALREPGVEAFRTECLRPISAAPAAGGPPAYEAHGCARVAAGRYRNVLRAEHLASLVAALARFAEECPPCVPCAS
jgi:hypothetical protein